MLKIWITVLLAALSAGKPAGNVYSAWTEDGIHLMISDAGTPGYYEDDFICDWETNRDFAITIHD